MDFFGVDNPVSNFFNGNKIMKYQQVYEDFSNMGWEAVSYIIFAVAVWIFLKLLHTCFSFPRRMNKQIDVQKMLQEKISEYEKYLQEEEEKEAASGVSSNDNAEVGKTGLNGTPPVNIQSSEEKWKERREFLETLKKELKRVRDGGDPYDWGHLLDDDENEKVNDPNAASISEINEYEDMEESATEAQKAEQIEDNIKSSADKKED